MRFLHVGRSKPGRPSATLLLFLAIVLLAQLSLAQKNANPDKAPATTAETTDATKATDPTTTEVSTKTSSKSTTEEKTTSTVTTTDASTTTDTSTTSTDSQTTATDTATSTPTDTTGNGYPVVTVPPTADAPYMKKSNIPEGTVFIAVGGALGLIGLSVLAWRALVAWSVNRSVRRAALIYASEKKVLRSKRKRSSRHSRAPIANLSLEKLPPHHRNSYNPRASQVPSTGSGLFFSPTAGAGMHTSGNRASSYLPAGYYSAGNAPGGSQNMPLSPADLRPNSQGYIRTKSNPSPPGSPGLSPSGYNNHARHSYAAGSTSSLNLASPTQGRTPSAFLEDLFESHAPQSDTHR